MRGSIVLSLTALGFASLWYTGSPHGVSGVIGIAADGKPLYFPPIVTSTPTDEAQSSAAPLEHRAVASALLHRLALPPR